jgi:hypothetical protein
MSTMVMLDDVGNCADELQPVMNSIGVQMGVYKSMELQCPTMKSKGSVRVQAQAAGASNNSVKSDEGEKPSADVQLVNSSFKDGPP